MWLVTKKVGHLHPLTGRQFVAHDGLLQPGSKQPAGMGSSRIREMSRHLALVLLAISLFGMTQSTVLLHWEVYISVQQLHC